jgi:hypothetical protein
VVSPIVLPVMLVASMGSLKVTVIGALVRVPVSLFAGLIEVIVGGVLSGVVVVKLIRLAAARGFPTRSVMNVVVWAFMTAPTAKSAAGVKDMVLFASLYTTVPLITVESVGSEESTVNVVGLIEEASIDSLNAAVMATLAGAVAPLGNMVSTVGATASMVPIIGVMDTFGTVFSVP